MKTYENKTVDCWGLPTTVPHTQDRASYNSSYRCGECYTEQRYSSALQIKVGTRMEVSREESARGTNSDFTQHYYQQQP